jgi:hypothetical protein
MCNLRLGAAEYLFTLSLFSKKVNSKVHGLFGNASRPNSNGVINCECSCMLSKVGLHFKLKVATSWFLASFRKAENSRLHACRKKSGVCTFTHLHMHANCNAMAIRMHARQLKLQVQTLRCMDACTRAF